MITDELHQAVKPIMREGSTLHSNPTNQRCDWRNPGIVVGVQGRQVHDPLQQEAAFEAANLTGPGWGSACQVGHDCDSRPCLWKARGVGVVS